MANNPEVVDLELSEKGQICVAKLQEVIAEFDLTGFDAIMAVGELFAWVHMLGLMSIGKERILKQIDRSALASRDWADANFDGFKARMDVVAALERGESGGHLQ